MKVLVTYGSRRGSTAEIAQAIAAVLRTEGCQVDAVPAGQIEDLTGYDAIVVGGALYAQRWHRDARRWVARHAEELRARHVWMFSSGPIGDPATQGEPPAVRQVARLAARVNARGHKTFGGRLAPDAKGLIASAMAKRWAGDWRDWDAIRSWSVQIAHELAIAPRPVVAAPPPHMHRWLVGLLSLVAMTAIGGGAALVAAPDGSIIHMSTTALVHSPFATYFVPGLLLLGLGLVHAVAARIVSRDAETGRVAAFIAGAMLLVWIVTEMRMLRLVHPLHIFYLAISVVTLFEALAGHAPRERHEVVRS